ncbi:MnhB domain-containing protein [Candidatus Latescibacterota bacterium]
MNGMSLIVKTISRLVLGFIIVFSASVILYGHISPGGGFAGGVMLAAGFVLLVLAFGEKKVLDIVGKKFMSGWDSFGLLSLFEFICIGLIGGFALKHYISEGEPLQLISAGTIMWSNLIVGIKVGVFLLAVFMAFAVFKIDKNSVERH